MDFVAALLAVGEFGDAIALVRQYGPLLLACVFFLWRDWRREDRQSQRITTLENEMRNIILPLVRETSTVIAQNTEVMRRLEKKIESH